MVKGLNNLALAATMALSAAVATPGCDAVDGPRHSVRQSALTATSDARKPKFDPDSNSSTTHLDPQGSNTAFIATDGTSLAKSDFTILDHHRIPDGKTLVLTPGELKTCNGAGADLDFTSCTTLEHVQIIGTMNGFSITPGTTNVTLFNSGGGGTFQDYTQALSAENGGIVEIDSNEVVCGGHDTLQILPDGKILLDCNATEDTIGGLYWGVATDDTSPGGFPRTTYTLTNPISTTCTTDGGQASDANLSDDGTTITYICKSGVTTEVLIDSLLPDTGTGDDVEPSDTTDSSDTTMTDAPDGSDASDSSDGDTMTDTAEDTGPMDTTDDSTTDTFDTAEDTTEDSTTDTVPPDTNDTTGGDTTDTTEDTALDTNEDTASDTNTELPDADVAADGGDTGSELPDDTDGEVDTQHDGETAEDGDTGVDIGHDGEDTADGGDTGPDLPKDDTNGQVDPEAVCLQVVVGNGMTKETSSDGVSCDVEGPQGGTITWGGSGVGSTSLIAGKGGFDATLGNNLAVDSASIKTIANKNSTIFATFDSNQDVEFQSGKWGIGSVKGAGEFVFCTKDCDDTTWSNFAGPNVTTPGNNAGVCIQGGFDTDSTAYARLLEQQGIEIGFSPLDDKAVCINLDDLITVAEKPPGNNDDDGGCSSTCSSVPSRPSVPGALLLLTLTAWLRRRRADVGECAEAVSGELAAAHAGVAPPKTPAGVSGYIRAGFAKLAGPVMRGVQNASQMVG